VDDDENLCKVLSEELNEIGYASSYCFGSDQAYEFIITNKLDLILLDLKMPDHDGFYFLKLLKENQIKQKVIVLTAYADVNSAIESAKLGAMDFVSKPYDLDELLVTIRKVLQTDLPWNYYSE